MAKSVKEEKSTGEASKKALVVLLACLFLVLCAVAVAIYISTGKARDIAVDSITDDGLRAYVSSNVDANGDGIVSVAEAGKIISMDVRGVRNLEGIGFLYNLQTLHAHDSELVSVDLSGLRALVTANLSGATNLERLRLSKNSDLESLYVANTGLKKLDLGGAGSLKILSVDLDVVLEHIPTTSKDLVDHYDAVWSEGSTTGEIAVDATYDAEKRMTSRTLSGSTNAAITYEYDTLGRLSRVVIDSPDSRIASTWNITYGENELDLHAVSSNGSHVDRLYDELGRPTRFEIDAEGLDGRVKATLSFAYGVTEMLSEVTLTINDATEVYAAGYDADGNLQTLTSEQGEAYHYDPNMLAAPLEESYDGKRLVRTFLYAGETAQISEGVYDSEGAELYRTNGLMKYTSAGDLSWGSVNTPALSKSLTFNFKNTRSDVPIVYAFPSNNAVDVRYLTSPNYAVDYWLPKDARWVFDQEIRVIATMQDVTRKPKYTSTYYSPEEYLGSTKQYDSSLSDILAKAGTRSASYAFCDIDGDYSSELLVSADGSCESILAIYTLVQETPVLCKSAQEGETLSLSGSGYLLTRDANGRLGLEHYNGLRFDSIDTASNVTDDSLCESYPALRDIEWVKE